LVPCRFGAQRAASGPHVICRRGVPVAAVCAFALMLAACGGDDGSSVRTQSSSTSSSTSTSTSTTTTTTAPIPPGTTDVTVGIICDSAEHAVQAAVQAWGANDRNAAGRCATPAVVGALFQTSGVGNSWFFQGCDRTDPGVPVCAYSYEGGAAFFTVEGTEAAGWKATKLEFLAD
jgi:hypothetical protein